MKAQGSKINGEKVLKKVAVRAESNNDIDHLLLTEKNIYATTVIVFVYIH